MKLSHSPLFRYLLFLKTPPLYSSYRLIVGFFGSPRYSCVIGSILKPLLFLVWILVFRLLFLKKGWQNQVFVLASTGSWKVWIIFFKAIAMLLSLCSLLDIVESICWSPIFQTFCLPHLLRHRCVSSKSHQWSEVPCPYILISSLLVYSRSSLITFYEIV